MSETVTLWCEAGDHEWTRDVQRGRRPHACPQCRSGARCEDLPRVRGAVDHDGDFDMAAWRPYLAAFDAFLRASGEERAVWRLAMRDQLGQRLADRGLPVADERRIKREGSVLIG